MSAEDKARLRAQALAARDGLEGRAARASMAAARLTQWLAARARGAMLAGYWPIRGEVDPRPALAAHAGPTCLPVVLGHNQPLGFRAWSMGQIVQPGPFGTFHPAEAADSAQPDVVIVPLAGFDRLGGRLGYGGGFYDRSLHMLRKNGVVTAVGLAFAAQELPALPVEPFDQPLDLVVTEDEIIFPIRD